MTKSAINKYLSVYSEPETKDINTVNTANWPVFKNTVVIPAYKESDAFVQRFLKSELSQQANLLIVVINQPDTEKNNEIQQMLWNSVTEMGQTTLLSETIALTEPNNKSAKILVVNRFSNPIPKKQGVGLARKVGTDIALKLYQLGKVDSPWLYSTDADASLPNNYFCSLSSSDQQVGAYFDFEHFSQDPLLHQANKLYERALKYYVKGLNSAGSIYAFPTIGSILAFKAEAYAQVRGFPKRAAGEDFYLMNKLAKVGKIKKCEHVSVRLDARVSDRVPFGTGPAVGKIVMLLQQDQDYFYYSPELFVSLKRTLKSFESLFLYRNNLLNWYDLLEEFEVNALKNIGLETFIEKRVADNERQFTLQLTHWFDAFKTLKFLHFIRDAQFPNVIFK